MRGARDDTVQRWDFKDLFGDESMTLADSRHLLTKPISSSLHRLKKNSIFAVTVEGLKGEGFKMFFYALYSFRKCKYHYKRHYTLAYLSESATACSYCISVSATMARSGYWNCQTRTRLYHYLRSNFLLAEKKTANLI